MIDFFHYILVDTYSTLGKVTQGICNGGVLDKGI